MNDSNINPKMPRYFACFLVLTGMLILGAIYFNVFDTIDGCIGVIAIILIMLMVLVYFMFKKEKTEQH
jgi:hypothetical protein